MAMWLRLALGLVLLAAPARAFVADEYGYRGIASTDPDGPVVGAFTSIAGTGTRVTFFQAPEFTIANSDDGTAVDLPLTALNGGAGFPFYGTYRAVAHMTTNGFLAFTRGATVGSLSNQCPLPGVNEPSDGIAVLWDDLTIANPPDATRGGYVQSFGTCPFAQGGAGACVVFEWYRIRHFSSPPEQAFTLQAVLYDDGDILLLFHDDNPEQGSASTTGLDGPGGFLGLTQACNTAASIATNFAVLFTAPADGRFGVLEVEPNDDQATASSFVADRCAVGLLPSPDAADLWRVTGGNVGDRVYAYADANGNAIDANPALALVIGAGETVIASDDDSGPAQSPVVAGVPLPIAGDAFVRIAPSLPGSSVGLYQLLTYIARPGDVASEIEPNDNILDARPLIAPVIEGNLEEGEIDHVAIDAVVGDVLTVLVDSDPDEDDENTRLDVSILGPDLGGVGYSDNATNRPAVAAGRGVVTMSGTQIVRLRRNASQGDSSYRMVVFRNCAVACADADADGACDAQDNCAGGANDQADGDGDGLGDACDGCPSDAAKTAAGLCGCGIADTDANGNGVVDCQANGELRARLEGLRAAVDALTKTKKKKPNPTADAVRARLDDVVAYLRSAPAGLTLASGDPNGMADELSVVVGKALKGAKFGKKKKKAAASVQAAYDAVGP